MKRAVILQVESRSLQSGVALPEGIEMPDPKSLTGHWSMIEQVQIRLLHRAVT